MSIISTEYKINSELEVQLHVYVKIYVDLAFWPCTESLHESTIH